MKQTFVFSLSLALVCCAATFVGAQDPNHVFSIEGISLADGGSGASSFGYSNTSADNIAGWSAGVCIGDAAVVDVTAVDPGTTTATIDGGGPPAFNAPAILPGQGWTVGVVINFFGMNPLPPGSGYDLHAVTYSDVSPPMTPGNSVDACCDILGQPPVVNTIVAESGASFSPSCTPGTIAVVDAPPLAFTYTAEDTADAVYNPMMDDSVSLDAAVSIDEDDANDPFPNDTAGFSMGLSHGPQVAVNSLDDSALQSLIGGPPAFFGPALLSDGWTVGVVYDFFGMITAAYPTDTPVISANYTVSGLLGVVGASAFPLSWSDGLGMPPVANTIVIGSDANTPLFVDGNLNTLGLEAVPFRRGDCNDDGLVNIADGIHILNRLFQGQPALGDCEEACDANDDGGLDSSDAVYIFNYRFLSGPPPPAPFPDCGTEPDADCNSYNNC